jgi:hypothetical protein
MQFLFYFNFADRRAAQQEEFRQDRKGNLEINRNLRVCHEKRRIFLFLTSYRAGEKVQNDYLSLV